jgi:uncharacterized protein YdeI (YjbR/CyaY-like superfamily)
MPPTPEAAIMDITEAIYLRSRARWRAWLKANHTSKREVWLIYYKQGTGKPRVPYGDVVEEALCFGWIDTTVKTIDAERYAQRFTPRKPGSNWSASNLMRVERLVEAGLMTPAGAVHIPSPTKAKAFHAKHRKRLTGTTVAPADLARALRAHAKAAAQWTVLTPGYRRLFVRWITDAKQEATRARRIGATVAKLARGLKHPMA